MLTKPAPQGHIYASKAQPIKKGVGRRNAPDPLIKKEIKKKRIAKFRTPRPMCPKAQTHFSKPHDALRLRTHIHSQHRLGGLTLRQDDTLIEPP
eukprot:scaffold296900_cov18-Tisochrysis_lutea.AAC.1